MPPGQHFALTYEIPDNFGGLTKAMLQRSWNLEEVTGAPVTVLTVGDQPNLDDVRADLVSRDLLHSPDALVNMWEDLAAMDHAELLDVDVDPTIVPDDTAVGPFEDADIHRPDGTLLARQRWVKGGLRAPATPHGDAVVATWLWDRSGEYVGGMGGTWALWRAWVAGRTAGAPAHVIIDSATVADAFATVAIPNTSISVVVHSSHLDASADPPYGSLGRWRKFLLDHRDGFDAVVFLTDRQRRDAELLFGAVPNAHTIANALPDAPSVQGVTRDERRGIALASLDGRKRLDHAVRAVARVDDTHLHLFGSGPREERLHELAATLGAAVTLEGQTSDPAAELAASSYLALTSSKEGLPLVLAEAMREGCVPIAYDIAYGPSDVITDGVDGYLVPAGDVKALTGTVERFLALPPRRRRAMRKAAQRRARGFEPASIVRRWSAVLTDAERRSATRRPVEPATDDDALQETSAMVVRFGEPRLSARLHSAVWTSVTEVRLEVDLNIECGPLPGELDVAPLLTVVEAVHRPTGHRTPLETVAASDASTVTIDTDALEQPLDHLILVTMNTAHTNLVAAIRDLSAHTAWSSAPAVERGGPRPTLELLDRAGLALVSALPVVVGTATLAPSMSVRAWGPGGEPVARFELSRPGSASISLVATDGEATIDMLPAGRWRVRAELDGHLRDVAWSGDPACVPGGGRDLTRVRLTPRGYLRLESRTSGATLEALDGPVLSGTCAGVGAPRLGDAVAHRENGTWHLSLDDVPPGKHGLVIDTQDVEASAVAQALLPATIDLIDRTVTVRRRGHRDAYDIIVERLPCDD